MQWDLFMMNSSLLGKEECRLQFLCYCRTILVKCECWNIILISAWHVCEVQCVRRMCEAGVLYYSPVEMTQMTGKSELTVQYSQGRMQKPFRTGTGHKPSLKPEAYCKFKCSGVFFPLSTLLLRFSKLLWQILISIWFKQYWPEGHPLSLDKRECLEFICLMWLKFHINLGLGCSWMWMEVLRDLFCSQLYNDSDYWRRMLCASASTEQQCQNCTPVSSS